MVRWLLLPPIWLCLMTALPAGADEPFTQLPWPGESPSTGRRLEDADKLSDNGQWAEAVQEYTRILDEAGNDLVAVSAQHSLNVRWLCHQRLAALPTEALRSYRNRVDGQARKWLEKGTATRDRRLLQRVVQETFCSSFTAQALELLGDLALERGDFHEAEHWWRLVVVPASVARQRAKDPPFPPPWRRSRGEVSARLELHLPGTSAEVPRVRAKQILAQLFCGKHAEAATELEAFQAFHAGTAGHLAGRTDNLIQTLRTLLGQPPVVRQAADQWATFAGDVSRNRVLVAEPTDPNRLGPLCRDGPAWRFPLDTRTHLPAGRSSPPEPPPTGRALPPSEPARSLAFHPVIAGKQVLVADARRVTAFDVTSGVSRSWDLAEDLGQDVAQLGLRTTLPAPADLHYTLSVEGDQVFARLGVQELRPGRKGPEAASFLVCLDLAERGTRLHCRWYKALTGGLQDSPAVFEGAPVVSDGRVYIAATRFTLNKAITAIHCYAVDMESGAAPRWVQDVVADREEALSKPRLRHLLLTLAGPNVVLCAPGGTIIAVNALTGQRAWAVRCPGPKNGEQGGFPSSSVLHTPSSEDPCLYAEGRLYAASSACNRLLCLDPATGQVLWERERLEVVHLLGVASGRVIFTTPRGIRAVCAVDGSDRGGWARPDYVDEVGLPSWGRGLLAGWLVFWPTTYGVKVLNQEDGTAPDDLIPLHLHNLPPGHMAYASGCLAVADAQTLSIYLSLARLPSRNQDAVELRKDEGRRKKEEG